MGLYHGDASDGFKVQSCVVFEYSGFQSSFFQILFYNLIWADVEFFDINKLVLSGIRIILEILENLIALIFINQILYDSFFHAVLFVIYDLFYHISIDIYRNLFFILVIFKACTNTILSISTHVEFLNNSHGSTIFRGV